MSAKKPKKVSGTEASPVKGKKPAAIKGVLKGYGYMFEYVPWSADVFSVDVLKIKLGIAALDPATKDRRPEAQTPEETYSITNDSCTCPAGDHGHECKHVEMIHGEYEGNGMPRDEAEDVALEYIDRFREHKGAKGTVIGPLAYGTTTKVRRADLLIYPGAGVATRDVVLYAEAPSGLLLRAIFARDEERYTRLLGESRVAWANKRRVI